jgi:hypothetical protein
MKDIRQAARSLRAHLGRPNWLSSVGVGSIDDHPAIFIFLVYTPIFGDPIPDEWEGFPVVKEEFGPIAPLGSW